MMKEEKMRLNDQGITLVELMVVFAIIAVLMIAGAFQYEGWIGRYRVESEVKQMYSDIMYARSLAVTRGKMYFINVPASSTRRYFVYEDSYDVDGGVEGDQKLEVANDSKITNGVTTYTLWPSSMHLAINGKGLITNGTEVLLDPEYVRFLTDPSVEPDYDCVSITSTRVNMGAWDDATNKCVEK